MAEDLYAVLGVRADASADEIKRAFRRLAVKHHPDKNPGDKKGAEERFKRINAAYEVLSNALSRRDYDQKRYAPPRARRAAARPAPPPPKPSPPSPPPRPRPKPKPANSCPIYGQRSRREPPPVRDPDFPEELNEDDVRAAVDFIKSALERRSNPASVERVSWTSY